MSVKSLVVFGWVVCASLLHAQSVPTTIAERYLLVAANVDRAAEHLPPLHLDAQLVAAARMHAFEMAKRHTISHQFPGEKDLASRAALSGAKFSIITENVAEAQNSGEIHGLWMASPGHRANLLDPHVDAVGIAVVSLRGEFYAVEDFAKTAATLSLMQQEEEVAAQLSRMGLTLDEPNRYSRETCELGTGFAGPRKPSFVMRYTTSDIGRLPDQLVSRIQRRRDREASVGACVPPTRSPFTSYSIVVLLFP